MSGEPTAGGRASRYDSCFATPLGAAMDEAESVAVIERRPTTGEHALDAGCGTCRYTRRLAAAGAGATATGVDADEENARRRPRRKRPGASSSRAACGHSVAVLRGHADRVAWRGP